MFAYGGAQLVVDSVSLEFVRGATVDYAAELIKSNFEVGRPIQVAYLDTVVTPVHCISAL